MAKKGGISGPRSQTGLKRNDRGPIHKPMDGLIKPEALKKGDTVLIISPSSAVEKEHVIGAVQKLASWGLRPEIAPHALNCLGHFAGSLKDRLQDLQSALDRQDVAAILCSRGGYGMVQLLGQLDFTLFMRHPKWVLGFSDITALHQAIQAKAGVMSLHCSMAKRLDMKEDDEYPVDCLRTILLGETKDKPLTLRTSGNKLNREGEALGILRGGNLSLIHALRKTPWDILEEDTILFIEDVSERPHAVERMLWNLRNSGLLGRIKGLIIGQFTDFTEDLSLGKPLYEALRDVTFPASDCPVCFDFPVGHFPGNLPLVEGAKVRLSVHAEHVELIFENI